MEVKSGDYVIVEYQQKNSFLGIINVTEVLESEAQLLEE